MNRYNFNIEDKFYQCAKVDKWEINPITGVVRNKITKKIIEPVYKENDYVRIGFKFTLHRLLAETFIKKPYPEGTRLHVHHIDGNKQNNKLENLMWLTPKEHFNLPEWIELQRNLQKGLQAGEKNGMYGYQWSEEQNKARSKKMYEVYKDPIHKQNLMNGIAKRDDTWRKNIGKSRKGKYIVNNGVINKFIEPHELQEYLDNGWVHKRLFKKNMSK